MRIALCLTFLAVSCTLATAYLDPLSDEYIELINSKQSTWKAGRNFNRNTTLSDIRRLLGALKSPRPHLKTIKHIIDKDTDIPATFDAREHWPNCEVIKEIQDQSNCGSCWAVAAASAMSDRICISSNATTQISVSAEDLLSCCGFLCGNGCNGGYPFMAWSHWHTNGIVSGGKYNTKTGCRAYSMAPCEHHVDGHLPACSGDARTPRCVRQCDEGSNLVYSSDRSHGKSVYNVDSDPAQIQLEILQNGPVEAAFNVYEDFISYKSGVYQHTRGDFLGGHAVRVLGWGSEKGTPYWLVANSWNEDWGDNGLFKIRRGGNNGGFEEEIVAGLPKL